ncbi:MAG: type II toxin-antitoxin system PemK/MazF family toxin [Acidobacteria bacterium]|nr:type II toxin-antitoxin system PemK/MazF family toxin [Acidobacteriota bacterium]
MIGRGDIYFVDLDPVKGREQSGRRPVLVLSVDAINNLPPVVTVVVGIKGENVRREFSTNVRVSPAESGLPIETVFLCFQIRSIDRRRFPAESAGKLAENTLEKVESAVRRCLGL